jgi:DNA-binding transcriptional MerR regulator
MSAEPQTIGEVLNRLKGEFDDVSISKIRFLESEGLITPLRSESGYRQFSTEDVERLRYILRAQRDRYLPLRVIRDELSRLDAGLPVEADVAPDEADRPAGVAARDAAALLTDVALDLRELAHASGLDTTTVQALIDAGLIEDGEPFDGASLRIARLAAELIRRGLEPRHLRAHRLSADREVSFVEQLVAPMLRQRNPESRRMAAGQAAELVQLGAQLHALLVEERLARLLGP